MSKLIKPLPLLNIDEYTSMDNTLRSIDQTLLQIKMHMQQQTLLNTEILKALNPKALSQISNLHYLDPLIYDTPTIVVPVGPGVVPIATPTTLPILTNRTFLSPLLVMDGKVSCIGINAAAAGSVGIRLRKSQQVIVPRIHAESGIAAVDQWIQVHDNCIEKISEGFVVQPQEPLDIQFYKLIGPLVCALQFKFTFRVISSVVG